MISYSLEQLYHFRCLECDKWFSIGDYQLLEGALEVEITCPHCGHVAVPYSTKIKDQVSKRKHGKK